MLRLASRLASVVSQAVDLRFKFWRLKKKFYRIVGNFRGMKLLRNCKIQFSRFLIHESLESGQ